VNHRARAVSTDGPRSYGRTFIVKLRAPNGNDAVRHLKAFLKLALRKFDLRCVAITEEIEQPTTHAGGVP
jgi:hypothetical protein